MKQFIIMITWLLIGQASLAQNRDTIDVFMCFDAVESNYPKTGEIPLIDKQTSLKIDNLKAQWYPNLDLNAQATYQSDVVEIDMDLPFETDFPSPSKHQYKATVDVNQMIYDGGVVRQSKKMERIGEELEKQ